MEQQSFEDRQRGVGNKTKTTFQFAFHWGSIIGFFTILYYVIGFYTGFDKKSFFNDIYFFSNILLIIWMFITYKREKELDFLSFSKMMLIGFYCALIVAAFYSLYFVLRITILDKMFFPIAFNEILQAMKNSLGIDYSNQMTPQFVSMIKVAFVISTYLSSLISSMIYTLLISAFMLLNQNIYRKK